MDTGLIGIQFNIPSVEMPSEGCRCSVMQNGAVVRQTEWMPNRGILYFEELPIGVYDVRVEGVGIVTVVKRGMTVTPNRTTVVIISLQSGKGVRVVEYTNGADAEAADA